MPYCSNCRTYIPDGVDTCPKCGTKDSRYSNVPPVNSASQNRKNSFLPQNALFEFLRKIFKTEDVTSGFNSSDISKNLSNAVLAYLGPFVIIPLIIARKSKFAMFHCCQGLINTVFGLLFATLGSDVLNLLPGIVMLLLLVPYLVLLAVFPISMFLGIIHAIKGKAITLPIFGRIDLMRVLFKHL